MIIFTIFFSTDAHKALGLLEDYRKKLPPESVELREALTRAIIAIRSRLFQALLGMVIKLILWGRHWSVLWNVYKATKWFYHYSGINL